MCCRSFKSESTNWAFVSLGSVKIGSETMHLMAACRCAYLYVWMQPSMHVDSVGRICLWWIRSATKNVQHGLPPAVMFHTQVTYWPPSTDFCHHVCPCPHRCLFNTKLPVCAEEISALHQPVFIFHGQYNGMHGWESIQTCVGNTPVAGKTSTFLYTGIYVDELALFACLNEGVL